MASFKLAGRVRQLCFGVLVIAADVMFKLYCITVVEPVHGLPVGLAVQAAYGPRLRWRLVVPGIRSNFDCQL